MIQINQFRDVLFANYSSEFCICSISLCFSIPISDVAVFGLNFRNQDRVGIVYFLFISQHSARLQFTQDYICRFMYLGHSVISSDNANHAEPPAARNQNNL